MHAATLVIGLLAAVAGADDRGLSDQELLAQAEAAVREGVRNMARPDVARPHFGQAANAYEELARRGACNPLLYRNLGSANLLADRLPQAILAFRHGLRLAPNDAQLQEALSAARQRVVYPEAGRFARPPLAGRPPGLPRLTSPATFTAALLLYVLGCAGVTRWWLTGWERPFWLGSAAVLVAFVLGSGMSWEAWTERMETHQPLVVLAADGVYLRQGNGPSYPRRYDTPLNRGVEARLLFDRGHWVQIELAGGEVGWVARADVLVDVL